MKPVKGICQKVVSILSGIDDENEFEVSLTRSLMKFGHHNSKPGSSWQVNLHLAATTSLTRIFLKVIYLVMN